MKTSHQLAAELLALPDVPVVVTQVSLGRGRASETIDVRLHDTDYQKGKALDQRSDRGTVAEIRGY